jgi:glycerophosphoryl diester phosphodiesterase
MKQLYLIPVLFLIINCTSINKPNPPFKNNYAIHAHRGSSQYPENMMTAFQHAIVQGADVLEMDLQITKDDKIVVAHDPYLREECTNRQGVAVIPQKIFFRDLKLSEVEEFDCGSRAQGKVTPVDGEGIPTLEHVLESFRRVETAKGNPVGFNIEIKFKPSQPEFYPLRAFYAKHVMSVIAGSGIDESRLLIQSFDVAILEEVRKLNPTIRLSPLIGDSYALIRAESYVKDLKTDLITPHYRFVTKRMVDSFHKMGVQVIPWTVNDEKTKKEMLDAGVDGVITDAVELHRAQ